MLRDPFRRESDPSNVVEECFGGLSLGLVEVSVENIWQLCRLVTLEPGIKYKDGLAESIRLF